MTGTPAAPAPPAPGTFRGAWAHRQWRWLLGSFSVSLVGDFLYAIALVVFLLDRTGSAGWVAAALVARQVPYALLGAPAGVLADRVDRRRLMIGLDLARAGLLAGLALVAWADGPAPLAIALAVLASVAGTPYRPAAVAATAHLVDEDDLAAANAAEAVVGQAAWFVGPALGAAVVALANPSTAFAVDAVTFVVSAALVARLGPIGGAPPTPQVADGDGAAGDEGTDADRSGEHDPPGVVAGLAAGVRAVRADPGLTALVLFTCATLFTFGMEQVLHVLVAVDRLGMGPEFVGVMAAAIGIGGLLAAPLTARLGRSGAAGALVVAAGVGLSLPLVVLGVTSSPVVALAALAVEGVATIVSEVLFITLLQRACPDHLLARVFGLQDSAISFCQLLGALSAPLLVSAVGLAITLWVAGGVTIVASFALAPALLALGHRTDRRRRELAPTAARLRRLALFAEASAPALEQVARAAVPVRVRAGDVVMGEGEAARDLFVVDAGELVVTSSGGGSAPPVEVGRMGPDDWFGEIGLLRRVPRTATVRAAVACDLVRIPGDAFLDAVGGPELLPDPVRRTIAVRLARSHHGRPVATGATPAPPGVMAGTAVVSAPARSPGA